MCTAQCAASLLAANPDPSSSSSSASSATATASTAAAAASMASGMVGTGERGMPPARTCRHGLIPGQQPISSHNIPSHIITHILPITHVLPNIHILFKLVLIYPFNTLFHL